jgi:hypothetical protein
MNYAVISSALAFLAASRRTNQEPFSCFGGANPSNGSEPLGRTNPSPNLQALRAHLRVFWWRPSTIFKVLPKRSQWEKHNGHND